MEPSIPGRMHRTTVYLPHDLVERAAATARSRSTSVAALIRQSLEQSVEERPSPTPGILGEATVRERYGLPGWLAVLDELSSGAWSLAPVDRKHLAALRVGVAAGATLAGASVRVLDAEDESDGE